MLPEDQIFRRRQSRLRCTILRRRKELLLSGSAFEAAFEAPACEDALEEEEGNSSPRQPKLNFKKLKEFQTKCNKILKVQLLNTRSNNY